MTKYSFLIFKNDYQKFLDNLREIGIVHIVERESEFTEDIRDKFQEINSLNKTIRFIKKFEDNTDNSKQNNSLSIEKGEKSYKRINEINQKIDQINQSVAQLNKIFSELQPWGKFDLNQIQKLNDKKIFIRFFVCQARKFDSNWSKEHNLFIINNHSGYIYFAIIEFDDKKADINAEEVQTPEKSPEELSEKINTLNNEKDKLNNELKEIANKDIDSLELYRKRLIENIEYEKALCSTQSEANDNLKIIETWCPNDKKEKLENFLNNNDVVYIKKEACEKDNAPILLKNKKFHKDFEVLAEMYSLPKYGELDLTPFFAPFYALFFGFCLGDIGYGILMVIAAIIAKPKVQKEIKSVMNLVAYLGTATILFGMISGTFFGINLYEANLPVYGSIQEYFEYQNTDINSFLFYLSLFIGAVQIVFGLILKAINETIQYGWKLAVGTIGWVILLIGMAGVFALGEYTEIAESGLKIIQNTILIISGLLILVFNNLKRKIYINIGMGLWNSYNMVTGILGDLLSYIRLFALGIASAILGYVFNSLALSMSGDIPVISIIIMIIILVIGHAINIFMSGLGAFVHPMRLSFVEFYKNAGFTGGGKKYKPFKKIINE